MIEDIRYDSFGRWYRTAEGVWCPSITTVTGILAKDGIAAWKLKVGEVEAERVSTAAKIRGTAMHGNLEQWLKREPYVLDGEGGELAGQLIPLMEKSLTDVQGVELPLWSTRLAVCGRCDLIASWDGEPSVIDFKSSKDRKKVEWLTGYFLQACFYCVAAWQCKGIRAKQIVIIVANNQGKPQVFVREASKYYEQLVDTIKHFSTFIPVDHFSKQPMGDSPDCAESAIEA